MSDSEKPGVDPEFEAMRTVHTALSSLDPDARERVWTYVSQRLGIATNPPIEAPSPEGYDRTPLPRSEPEHNNEESGEAEGISPVALKWMRRNGIGAEQLTSIFSLGIDEIDLVADTVPGKSKRERMHNVLRLSAIAAYLASGAARVSHESLKEACLHYDAFDGPNFAKTLKSLGREVSGTKESGYTLTASGVTAATSLVKKMMSVAS